MPSVLERMPGHVCPCAPAQRAGSGFIGVPARGTPCGLANSSPLKCCPGWLLCRMCLRRAQDDQKLVSEHGGLGKIRFKTEWVGLPTTVPASPTFQTASSQTSVPPSPAHRPGQPAEKETEQEKEKDGLQFCAAWFGQEKLDLGGLLRPWRQGALARKMAFYQGNWSGSA